LTLRKFAMLWNRREYPQIENADEFRQAAGPLGLPVAGEFLVFGALGLAGLWIARRYGAAGWFLSGYAVITMLGIVPFFVTDRYRFHLVPAVALLSALVLDQIWKQFPSPHRRAIAELGILIAAGLVLVNLPAPELSKTKYSWGLAGDLGTRWLERRRPDLAVREFERALAIEPRAASASDSIAHASLYHNYALALSQLGRADESLPWFAKAARFAPTHATVLGDYAEALQRAGRTSSAESLYARLEGVSFGEGSALTGRGYLAARNGRLAEAEQLFRQAVAANPRDYRAWGALIRVVVQTGRPDDADQVLEQAVSAGMGSPTSDLYGALIAAARGQTGRAESILRGVPSEALASDPVLADVARVTRSYIDKSIPK
jgi:Flp pilus assembly protein TadD